jgi:hypothetical protein
MSRRLSVATGAVCYGLPPHSCPQFSHTLARGRRVHTTLGANLSNTPHPAPYVDVQRSPPAPLPKQPPTFSSSLHATHHTHAFHT